MSGRFVLVTGAAGEGRGHRVDGIRPDYWARYGMTPLHGICYLEWWTDNRRTNSSPTWRRPLSGVVVDVSEAIGARSAMMDRIVSSLQQVEPYPFGHPFDREQPGGRVPRRVRETGRALGQPAAGALASGARGISAGAVVAATGARQLRLYLGEGTLRSVQERNAGQVRWVHDPSDQVPSVPPDPFSALALAADESALHARPDAVTFTTAPLTCRHDSDRQPNTRRWISRR